MIGTQIIGAVLTLYSIFGAGYSFGQEATSSSPKSTAAISTAVEILINPKAVVLEGDIEEYVREFFNEHPLLVEIAKCESTMTHITPAGTVIRGKANPKDVGLMQINEKYHLEKSISMGFDIYSLEGNMAYAKYLFMKEGATPWKPSSKCWSKTDAYEKLVLSK